ncbi:MAG: glycosyltransferase [Magnetococcales bacterium]|nr:glycosyltransferase [Magnetococcales bacterium]
MTVLSVVIPAYQEGANLAILLPRLIETLRSLGQSYEILIVDTETPLDDTPAICGRYAADGVRCLPRREGPSFGSAVRTGINASTGEFVVCMDGDGSHDPEFIRELYRHRHEAHVIVASRYTEGGGTENILILQFLSWLVNYSYRLVFSLNCRDVSNSFKLYPGQALRTIRLVSENFEIVEEILIKLKRQLPDLTIRELPFLFRSRKHGKTKRQLVLFIFTFASSILRLRFMK